MESGVPSIHTLDIGHQAISRLFHLVAKLTTILWLPKGWKKEVLFLKKDPKKLYSA